MSPMKFESVASEGTQYSLPFLGSTEERLSERLDVSALDGTNNVDSNGYLIPGAVLRLSDKTLLPISAGAQTARGVVLEAVKVAEGNSTTQLNAAADVDVVIVVSATVDRAIAEYNLDRSYTADELTAFDNNDRLTLTDPES